MNRWKMASLSGLVLLGMLAGCTGNQDQATAPAIEDTDQKQQTASQVLQMKNETGAEITGLSIRVSEEKDFTSLLKDQSIKPGKKVQVNVEDDLQWPEGPQGEIRITFKDDTESTLHNVDFQVLSAADDVQMCMEDQVAYLQYTQADGTSVSTLEEERKLAPEKTKDAQDQPEDNTPETGTPEAVPPLADPDQESQNDQQQNLPYEEPVYQDPTYQNPGYQDPGYQTPNDQNPGYQDPGYQIPGYDQPIYDGSGTMPSTDVGYSF